jgi:hypothetical protein
VTTISRAIKLCGTDEPDAPGRILSRPDAGGVRQRQLRGPWAASVLAESLGFLVRDENWGTYTPRISELLIDQRSDGFSVSFHAVCSRPGQEIAYNAKIEGYANGDLEFEGVAVPKTDFLTARTGFVVLHPLKGVAGCPVTVEHVDGKVVNSKFPPLVDPIQPFLAVRALTHEVSPGRQRPCAWRATRSRWKTIATGPTHHSRPTCARSRCPGPTRCLAARR